MTTAQITRNDESGNYEVESDDEVYESIHTSGTVCVCQLETNEAFECGVFFGDAGGDGVGGELRLHADGDTQEIDGVTYEASSTAGWTEIEGE